MNTSFAVAPPPSAQRVCGPPCGLIPRRSRLRQNAFATPRRTRRCVPLSSSRPPPSDEERLAAAAISSRNTETSESYLQCVECSALYAVEPEELEGAPRVVGCSACLHEWYASEADLLWGPDEALAALKEENSFEARSRKAKEDGRKAFNAAQGVGTGSRKGKAVTAKDATKGEGGKGKEERELGTRNHELEKVESTINERETEESDAEGIEEESRFNVFVGNLSFRATEEDLYRAFSGYGAVLKCQVPADSSGASRGYGFVEMRNRECGLRAIESLQGTSILGRDVSLNEARPRKDNSSTKKQQTRAEWIARDKSRSRDFTSRASGNARAVSGFRKDKKKQKESTQDRLKSSNKS